MALEFPPLSDLDLDAYLERVGISAPPSVDLEGLTALSRAHLFSIPFENLDIPLGVEISLDPANVFDKLVTRKRGGFCYEQNSLMACVLHTIGFDVEMLSSRVAVGPRAWGPPFDHMTLRVTLDEPFLVDVGFGDSFRDPLPIGRWSLDSNGSTYRAQPRDDGLAVARKMDDPRLGRLYLTDPVARRLGDFGPMCTYQQTSPYAWFTQTWVTTLPLPDGRMTLSPGSFTRTRSGIARRRDVGTVTETESILRQRFAMESISLPSTFPIERARRPSNS